MKGGLQGFKDQLELNKKVTLKFEEGSKLFLEFCWIKSSPKTLMKSVSYASH